MGGSLPFQSGVVVSLRPLSVCPGPMWLVPALFPSLSTFAMGSPLRGRGQIVLDRNEGLVSPFGSGSLVSSWLDILPLSAGICAPCHSGYVAWWSSLCPYHWVNLSSLQGSSQSLVGVKCCLPDPC